jgi:beta-lactamase regulating signal transducer with metallopeptidase domain/thiol-disulfide isomerase/thioredoxin
MNPTLFLQALGSNSLQGAVLVVLVLVVQWIFHRQLTPGWRCALWLLLVARLLLPISASSTVSVYNLTPALRPAVAPQAQPSARLPDETDRVKAEPIAVDSQVVDRSPAVDAVRESAPAAVPASAASSKPAAKPIAWPQVLLGVWAAGTVVLLTRLFVLSVGLARRVRGTVCKDPKVLAVLADCMTRSGLRRAPVLLESAAVSTPAVFGFFRPSLLMPPGFRESFSQTELRYIFLHELAHIRRHDLLVNALMALIQAVHWFNPLVWFGFARWRLDRELACDASALDALGGTHQRDYGETILRLLQQPPVHRLSPGLIGISEDRQQLKRRISQIARFTPTRRVSVLSLLLLGALAAVGLTDPSAQKTSTQAATPPPAVVSASPAAAATPAYTGRVHALTIRVKDGATNQPVAGAKVSIYGPSAETVTDEAGVAILSVPVDVPGAERLQNFQMAVTSPRHSSKQVMWISASGGVRATLPAQYDISLSAGISVGGVVRDENGAPVVGAKIKLYGSDYAGFRLGSGIQTHQEYPHVSTGETSEPVTDAQGAWRYDRFPADLSKLTITVARPGGAQTTFVAGDERRPSGPKETPIVMNTVKDGSIVLIVKNGVTVRGLVTDADGQPLGGVQLRARDASTRNLPYRITTDSAGMFELANWDAARVLLTAERDGYRTTSITFPLQADAPVLKIALAPAKPLRIRVLGENSEPIVNAQVQTNPNPSPTQIIDWKAATDAEGRVVWSTAPDSPVDLWVSPKDYPHRTVRLTANETEHVIRLRHGTEKAISVQLRVLDAESGQPLPAFEVWRRMPSSQFVPWGEPATQGKFNRQITADEFPKGIVESYRLQVRAPGYTGWNSEIIEFSNGDQDLAVKLTKGESTVAAVLPSVRAGEGINGDTHPGLIPLAANVARLLETGDIPAFLQTTVATSKDWETQPAMAARETPSQVKRHEKALTVSAEHVLQIARQAGLAPGTMKFQVKSVGWSRNQSTINTRVDGKVVSVPYLPALTVILAGEPTGAVTGRPLRGDYQLSFGSIRETSGGWRADDGIRWQTLPAGMADPAILRELRLANQVAPGTDPVGITLSGADDSALLQLGEAVIALVKSRAVSPFVSSTVFSPTEATDFFQRAEWGSAKRAAEMQTAVTTGLTVATQAILDLQERLGVDFSDAKLTVRQVLAERPSFSRFGEIEGLRAGPVRVSFSVESARTAKSGRPLAGNYVVVLGDTVRTKDRWYLVRDKIRWQEFPQGLVAGDELERVAFENHIAEKGTLPPGTLAPDIKLESLTAQPATNLSAYRGKVVILEFWASWCGPCQEPMDKLQKLVAEHPEWKDRVEVLALSIDDELKDAQEHLAKKQWSNTANRWAGRGGFTSAPSRDFRLRGVPTVYVLGADGKVAAAGHPESLDLAGLVNQQLKAAGPK